jgi:hypothetical protein
MVPHSGLFYSLDLILTAKATIHMPLTCVASKSWLPQVAHTDLSSVYHTARLPSAHTGQVSGLAVLPKGMETAGGKGREERGAPGVTPPKHTICIPPSRASSQAATASGDAHVCVHLLVSVHLSSVTGLLALLPTLSASGGAWQALRGCWM